MAVAISVTLEPDRMNTRLDVTGLTGATFTLWRTSPSGNLALVRGQVHVPVTASEMIGRDWEAPLDIPLTYGVTVYDSTGAQIDQAVTTFTLAWDQCDAWLGDLARPTNSLAVEIVSLPELTFDYAQGVHRVLDRRAPVLTTLPAYTPSGTLTVLTETLTDRDRVRNLLGTGSPFLLRTSPDMGIGNMYLGATQFVEVRFMQLGDRPQRQFRIAVVQVDRPDPSVFAPMAPNTWQNVHDTYASWAAMQAAVGTWDRLAYVYPDDPNAPTIEPWPPDDI